MRIKHAFIIVQVGFVAVALSGLVVNGCGTGPLNPPKGPGTAYPCGYFGVSCRDYDGSATCCPEHHACKPNDMCEYQGHDGDPMYGASKPVKRTAEKKK